MTGERLEVPVHPVREREACDTVRGPRGGGKDGIEETPKRLGAAKPFRDWAGPRYPVTHTQTRNETDDHTKVKQEITQEQ